MPVLSMLVLNSGSKGNCTFLTDGTTGILVDCGISTRQILLRLEHALPEARIHAIFITHEHTDHIGSAAILQRRLESLYGTKVPVYMSNGTYISSLESRPQCVPDQVEFIAAGDSTYIGQLLVESFWVPHDVVEPLAFRVALGEVKAAIITDLGHVPDEIINILRGVSLLSLEFNHDTDILMDHEHYPYYTKLRIKGPYGHLSNEQGADALSKILSPQLEHVVLSHISDNSNTPELAMASAQKALESYSDSNAIQVHVASQTKPLPLISSEFEVTTTLPERKHA